MKRLMKKLGLQIVPALASVLFIFYSLSGADYPDRVAGKNTSDHALTVVQAIREPGYSADSSVAEASEAPLAVACADMQSGPVPLTVRFDGSLSDDPEGPIASYQWSFDPGTDSGSVVTHTFDQAGEYLVLLTVTDNEGQIAMDMLHISVGACAGKTAMVDEK